MKRILAALLALCLTTAAAGAMAACVCEDCPSMEGADGNVFYMCLKDMPEDERIFYGPLPVFDGETVNLCLHGKLMGIDPSGPCGIRVEKGGTLNIYDCVGGGEILLSESVLYYGQDSMETAAIVVEGTLNMYGGKIGSIGDNEFFGGGEMMLLASVPRMRMELPKQELLPVGIYAMEGAKVLITGDAQIEADGFGVISDDFGGEPFDLTVSGNARIESGYIGAANGGSTKIDGDVKITGQMYGIAHKGKNLSIAKGRIEIVEDEPEEDPPENRARTLNARQMDLPKAVAIGMENEDGMFEVIENGDDIIADGSYVVEGDLNGTLLVVDRIPAGELPGTGDPSMLMGWAALLSASAAGLMLRRKKN